MALRTLVITEESRWLAAAGKVSIETRMRQIALGLCVGMSVRQMAEVLELAEGTVNVYRFQVLRESGMAGNLEFALRQNAAVRERIWP